MEFMELIKVYGPLAMGWVVAFWLIKFILDRYQADIEGRTKLATALDGLTRIIEHMGNKDA